MSKTTATSNLNIVYLDKSSPCKHPFYILRCITTTGGSKYDVICYQCGQAKVKDV